ncbi:hypothetical protein ACFXDF_46700, partial [Streptomyces sp. NPDC059426]|uniref:hypothetical protein n=1 Tax=Streptomyces sp. NPDC059426 TaxID=3346827 RepID=UPI0036A747BA
MRNIATEGSSKAERGSAFPGGAPFNSLVVSDLVVPDVAVPDLALSDLAVSDLAVVVRLRGGLEHPVHI